MQEDYHRNLEPNNVMNVDLYHHNLHKGFAARDRILAVELSKSDKAPLLFDRASAEYARNNTIAIAQKLVHYLNELKSK